MVDTPGPVTSAKIEEDADIAVLDKNIYIATVSEGGKLELELRVKNGRGYVAADRNFDEDLPIGYIPIDSVHSPVRKVNYAVEAARLGQMTDYEKLTLEVWTNAAITPQDSIGLASKLDQGPHEHLHQLRRTAGFAGRGHRELRRSSPGVPGPLGRRARTFGALLQLLEEREHSESPRAGAEDRIRNAEDQEFRRASR